MQTLRQFRSRRKITQKDLAKQVGVTPSTLSKYESGEWVINQAVIYKIKEMYGVDIRPLKSRKKTWQVRRNAYLNPEIEN